MLPGAALMQSLYNFMFLFIPMIMVPLVTDWIFPSNDYDWVLTRFYFWPFLLIFYSAFMHFIHQKLFQKNNSNGAAMSSDYLFVLPGLWIFTICGDEILIPLFIDLIRYLVL